MSSSEGAAVSPARPDDVLAGFAADVGTEGPVVCVGGRTRWGVGGAADEQAREVRAPSGVVEHEPAEMTVRVRAGTTVVALQERLAVAGQRVLLPAPGEAATVGGVLAVGESDVRRLAYGPLRDVLLEARYVSADGRVVKAGGPTVKNVSGFDLCRLLVGSLGTLGFLGEVILRTRPVPETSAWFGSSSSGIDPIALQHELYRPASVLWERRGDGGTSVFVLLEGRAVDVKHQSALLARHGLAEVDGAPALPEHVSSHAPSSLRALVTGDIGGRAMWLEEGSGRLVAEVGVGTVHSSVPLAAPPAASEVVELNRRIKHEFDPTGRLNPGRDPLARLAATEPVR